MIWPHAIRDADAGQCCPRSCRYIENAGVGQFPATLNRLAAVGVDDRFQDAAGAVVHRNMGQPRIGISPCGKVGMDQVVAVTHPHIGHTAARIGDRPEFDRLPFRECGGRTRDDAFVEHERDDSDKEASDDERGKHLMRGEARCLHRDDFTVLVQRHKRNQGAEQDGEGQEPLDDSGRAQ